ncbi:hypothetical protein AG1IA_08089 [Rhizoctonia solani AG-1 IA]|uniref:Uncharacterized protein n=1 Tax=Thanatephorus cucumeris (strain AG1-IA) TaxID=983506 RepID=L8WI58_THACA|nr:hypothetical protein AG1IA_08089 [Rhizoctonia solani AG-1 IA]
MCVREESEAQMMTETYNLDLETLEKTLGAFPVRERLQSAGEEVQKSELAVDRAEVSRAASITDGNPLMPVIWILLGNRVSWVKATFALRLAQQGTVTRWHHRWSNRGASNKRKEDADVEPANSLGDVAGWILRLSSSDGLEFGSDEEKATWVITNHHPRTDATSGGIFRYGSVENVS